MKRLTPSSQSLIVALLAGSFTAGCSSTPSNTQRGAASGAALGALAGAVIGNNRGSGNAASGAAIGAVAGAIAGGAIGRNADRRGQTASSSGEYSNAPYTSQSAAQTNIYVNGAPPLPPAPQAESIPAQPTSGAVWIPGYWSYESGSSYAWVPGRWEMPPQGARSYQSAQWRRQGNGYVYVRGFWQ